MEGTSRTDIRVVDKFEPDVFWERHGKKIITAGVAILVVGIVVFYWQRQAAEREQRAAASLAGARDIRSLGQVVEDYPKSEVAAQALLRLGDMHFQAGQYSDAATAYQRFVNNFPSHPMIESALLGMAAVQESQGNLQEARAKYTQIVNSYPKGYAAWSARMGAARCSEGLGQIKEAQQAYEEILSAGRGSPWQSEAYLRWVVLGRDHKDDLPAQPQSPQQDTLPSLGAAPMVPEQK